VRRSLGVEMTVPMVFSPDEATEERLRVAMARQ
jgi:hypothetical protein